MEINAKAATAVQSFFRGGDDGDGTESEGDAGRKADGDGGTTSAGEASNGGGGGGDDGGDDDGGGAADDDSGGVDTSGTKAAKIGLRKRRPAQAKRKAEKRTVDEPVSHKKSRVSDTPKKMGRPSSWTAADYVQFVKAISLNGRDWAAICDSINADANKSRVYTVEMVKTFAKVFLIKCHKNGLPLPAASGGKYTVDGSEIDAKSALYLKTGKDFLDMKPPVFEGHVAARAVSPDLLAAASMATMGVLGGGGGGGAGPRSPPLPVPPPPFALNGEAGAAAADPTSQKENPSPAGADGGAHLSAVSGEDEGTVEDLARLKNMLAAEEALEKAMHKRIAQKNEDLKKESTRQVELRKAADDKKRQSEMEKARVRNAIRSKKNAIQKLSESESQIDRDLSAVQEQNAALSQQMQDN